MPIIVSQKFLSEEEYFDLELHSEVRHEYDSAKLIEIPGESDLNNEIAANILILLGRLLKSKGYSIYIEGVKVKIPNEPKYYYPDVFATKEITSASKQYIKYEPEIIVEVLSDATRKYDMVDKFISYQKIPSMLYYILVEPEKVLVQCFYRENDQWEAISFTNIEDSIELPLLNIQLEVKEIYS